MREYQSYKPSGVDWLGLIPTNWNRFRMKFCFNGINGGVWGEEPIGDQNDIICIRVADFNYEYGIIDTTNLTTRNISVSEQRSRLLKKGDLLIEKSGGGELSPVGRVVKFDLDIKAVCSNFINRLNTKNQFNADYLNYLNRFLYSKGITESCINQTTGIQNLKVSEFVSKTIFIPSLLEQQFIVGFLDYKTKLIDNFIANRQKQIGLLKEQKAGIINKAVTKGINPDAKMKPSGIKWIGEIPDSWEVWKLKFLVKKISKGTTPSTEGRELLDLGAIRFLKAENITNDGIKYIPEFFIDEETNHILKRSQLQPNDILFVIAGATIGKVAIITNEFIPANTNQAVCFIRLKKKILPELVFHQLQSNYVKNKMTVESVVAAQPNISMGDIGDFQIFLPPIEEHEILLRYIQEETKVIDTLISKYQKQIDLMHEYRISLVSQAVTGKIDVREW